MRTEEGKFIVEKVLEQPCYLRERKNKGQIRTRSVITVKKRDTLQLTVGQRVEERRGKD